MTTPDVPAVTMLWESDDPATALSEQFGFADAVAAAGWVSRTVEQHWGIKAGTCERITMSFKNALVWFRTPDGRLLAKWSIATHRVRPPCGTRGYDRVAGSARATRLRTGADTRQSTSG